MRFFTRGWTYGDMTDEAYDAVIPAYWRYVRGLELPESIDDLAHLNPHDAFILDVDHQPEQAELLLRLRCGDLQAGYFDAILRFLGVAIDPEYVAWLQEARHPENVEIVYDEVDRFAADRFCYRILLDPVGEISFEFEDVTLTRAPVASRDAA